MDVALDVATTIAAAVAAATKFASSDRNPFRYAIVCSFPSGQELGIDGGAGPLNAISCVLD